MIKKLPYNFKKNGTEYLLIFENEIGYVYMTTGNASHYEVFLKRTEPVKLNFGRGIYSKHEKKEVYPESKDFGKWAWRTIYKDEAINKLTN